MKKRTLAVLGLVLSMSLIIAGSAFARWGGGYGMMGGGYERGDGYGPGTCFRDDDRTDVSPEAVTKFRKETLQLRDELLTKRLELSQEYDKETPDADRVAKLRKEIIDIETGIGKVADKYDLDNGLRGRRGARGNRGGYNCQGPGGCF